jgi:hypothetical protein
MSENGHEIEPSSDEPQKSDERNQQLVEPEIFVFSTLALLGGGLLALVSLTAADWYFPALFYGVPVYVAWRRYF